MLRAKGRLRCRLDGTRVVSEGSDGDTRKILLRMKSSYSADMKRLLLVLALAVADAPMGPYEVKGLMSEQKTWRSQISSFCHIPETDTLFALCEQWLIGLRLGLG